MKLDEAKTILDVVRKASIFDIIIVSLVLLPLLLGGWLILLDNVIKVDSDKKIYFIIILFIIYIIGIAVMKIGLTRDSKKRMTGTRIRNYLVGRNKQMMSFSRIREVIDKNYSDDYLKSVIDKFPEEFRFARIKGGKPGIGLFNESEE